MFYSVGMALVAGAVTYASDDSCFREPDLVLLDMQSVPARQEGWLVFDVTAASNRWLVNPQSNLGIRLYVETEEGEVQIGGRLWNISDRNK